jgi:NADH dehydrogenase
MLPGTKRKWRLLIDWNIQVIFGRDGSELGGLGRAPGLGHDPTVGGTPAVGSVTGLGAPDATGDPASDPATAPVAPS